MGYATGLLEFSNDPLSDATPTYQDRSSYVVGDVTWTDGKSRDLDDPQAGSITFRLKSPNGEWVPNSPDSLYPDSPFILRRFRWSVNGTAEGIWYVTGWQVTYPAGTSYSEIQVTAVDGFELLSLDALDLLDPPTASSYEDVVMADAPFGYWRLDDPATASKAAAIAGPEGVYKGRAELGLAQEGALAGDENMSVKFTEAGGVFGRVEVPMAGTEWLSSGNALTIEVWLKGATAVSPMTAVYGPRNSSLSAQNFFLGADIGGKAQFSVTLASGSDTVLNGATNLTNGVWHHVVGVFDSGSMKVYLDGELDGTTTSAETLVTPTSGSPLRIGADATDNLLGSDGWIDEVAIYEQALSVDRVLAHYTAGAARGFDEQTAGERVAAVVASALWAETEIQTGEHMVHPVMEHGQSKLDEIRAAVKAEMPDSLFYFNGDGDPTYLAWNYKDGLGSQGTFGPGSGEVGYQGIELVYDDEMFNEVTVGHESAPGEETQHTVTDTDSSDEFYRRAHAETGLILSEHHDAIAVAQAILDKFSRPQLRVASLTLNGAHTAARTHILDRQIGDMVRVKGVNATGAAVDVVTTILGRSKTLTRDGHLTCTWNLARGFNADAGVWQLGIDGFSELGETTVLA